MKTEALPLTTANQPLTDRLLYRGMRINILAGALGMVWVAMTQGMPLTMLMEALGASGTLIGSVSTVLQVGLIMQVAGAFFASHLQSRKPVWAGMVIVSRMLWYLPALMLLWFPHHPLAVATAVIWITGISALMGQSVSALWWSWMTDLIPERMRGRFWGIRQSGTMIAFLVGMAAAGYLLDVFPPPRPGIPGSWTGFVFLFVIGATLGTLDIVVHVWVPEPKPHVRDEPQWFARLIEPLRNADFRRLTLAMGIFTFSIGLVSLGIVYLKKDFSVTYSQLAALTISSSLGTIASGFIWGYILDRLGGRPFGAAMVAIAPLFGIAWFFVKDYSVDFVGLFQGIRFLGPAVAAAVDILPATWSAWIRAYSLPQPVWIHLFVSFFAGGIFGGIGLAQVNLSGMLAPREGRTMAMGIHWAVIGIIGALGSFVAGVVMDAFLHHPVSYVFPTGTRLAFHHVLVVSHMALMWCVVLPMLLRIRRRQGEPHFVIAVSQIFMNNPLRALTNIYMMGAAVSRRQRARAVHNLGTRRTALAVSDLIEKLDDPSYEVREEAAFALGSIGTPEAVAALLAKMDDPQSDVTPPIIRALRMAKDPSSVDRLLRRLHDPDREVVAETCRALGELGDARAVHPLLDVLSASDDQKVLFPATEALARLREVSAVYKLIPRLRAVSSPLLKRTLTVSIGEMIGEPDEFYKILTNEQRSRGTEAGRLVRRLRRELARAPQDPQRCRELQAKAELAGAQLDDQNQATCADLLYEIGVGMAQLRFALAPGDTPDAFISDVFLKDKSFGAGLWYLHNLRQPWISAGDPDNRNHVDLLLGLYFLASRRLKD